MVRAPCCEMMGLKKGPWTPEEDQILVAFIQRHGHGNWRALPKQAGLLRCGKSCRLRWINYLRPDIKRGSFSKDEEETILKLHQVLGNRWSMIAAKLPGRTDNDIKNYWHSHLKKRFEQNLITTKSDNNNNNNVQTLLQRDHHINNAATQKPENFTTHYHQGIQNPPHQDNTPIFRAQSSQIEAVADSTIINDGTDASSEGIMYERSDSNNNVMEFWYSILMEAAGNSIEIQNTKAFGHFG